MRHGQPAIGLTPELFHIVSRQFHELQRIKHIFELTSIIYVSVNSQLVYNLYTVLACEKGQRSALHTFSFDLGDAGVQ